MSDAVNPAELLERSKAFQAAALRSEERRAYAVILVVGLLALPIAGFSTSVSIPDSLKIVGAGAGMVLMLAQLGMIGYIRRCRRFGTEYPTWLATTAVTLECSIPTLVIAAHLGWNTVLPYVAITAPPPLAYGVLIGLTTLRLRPWLCLWAGVVAAVGYASLVGYARLVRGLPFPEEGWPAPGYLMATLLIFSTGMAAAWVTVEIRRHLEAALGEAETRRKMERVEQDLEVARTIQRSLLPGPAPSIAGFDIAAWNQPADQTGGDYYDWLELPGGDWLVTLADVAGHGIGPALITSECRAYVRALAERKPSLPELLAAVNRLLSADLPAGRFITMAAVCVKPGTGEMSVLSAGHGPLLLWSKRARRMESVPAAALPLAVTPDLEPCEPTVVELYAGDVLALVTDGFVEWAKLSGGTREEFGVQRLSETLAAHADKPAAQIVEEVLAAATSFAAGVPQQDDLTIVIIKRVAPQ